MTSSREHCWCSICDTGSARPARWSDVTRPTAALHRPLNGLSVKSCTVLAVQADGCEVTTIEGLASDGELHPVQQAFHENHALQCGFCTPGMIMQAASLLNENPDPSDREIRDGTRGQPVPVHRLPEHRQGRAPGSGEPPMTVTEEASREHPRGWPGAAPQGRSAADHRSDSLHRQHLRPRHAVPRHGAQPYRAREDHFDRCGPGQEFTRRGRGLHWS